MNMCFLMVKNMCFLLRGHKFKSTGGVGYVYLRRLYQSNRWAKGVPCPTNKGVSYTNLVWLSHDLKNRLLLLLLLSLRIL
jgi:hypothetical protein